MEVDIERRNKETEKHYDQEDIDIAYEFTKEIHDELGDLLKSVVLFGSVARKAEASNDIDILLLVDDVSIRFTEELVQAYRVIVKRTVMSVSEKIHVTSMKLSTFWEYVREGDPIATNILREGYSLIDTGIFAPLQHMLHQGRIGSSNEAIWAYLNRSEERLVSVDQHFLDSINDLYWSAVDAGQAVLMYMDEKPPSPRHVPNMLKQTLVRSGRLKRKDVKLVRKLYSLSKDIAKGKKTKASPKEVKKLRKEVERFVETVQDIILEDA